VVGEEGRKWKEKGERGEKGEAQSGRRAREDEREVRRGWEEQGRKKWVCVSGCVSVWGGGGGGGGRGTEGGGGGGVQYCTLYLLESIRGRILSI